MGYSTLDGYEPTSLEADIFLSDIPVALMKENIKAQFSDPLENNNDYITVFIDTYNYSKENSEDEYELAQLESIRDDFFVYVRKIFKDYLRIGFPDFEDKSEKEQNNLIKSTYRYFIINIKKNFTRLIINYIDTHKKTVVELCDKKKDVTTLAYKKEIQDPDDLAILANLTDVVDNIWNDEIDVDTFIRLSDHKCCYENQFLNQAYDNVDITGNFVQMYKHMIDNDFKSEIETKVRHKILKKTKL